VNNLRILAVLLILAAGAAVYYPALDYGFINWDDPPQVLNNPLVRDLSPAGVGRIFTSRVVRQYHPLVTLSFALEYRFFELNPVSYHLHNLLLHLLNGLLVFVLAYRLSGRRSLPAFLAGLFFTVHPLQAGAVCWISGRKDLLAAAFFLLSLLAYQRFLEQRNRTALGLALALGIAALLSKATAAVLPLALLLSDWRAKRGPALRLLLEKAPLLVASGAIAALSLFWQLKPEAGSSALYGWDAGNFLLAARTLLFYLRASVFPFRLLPFYPAAPPAGPLSIAILAGLALWAFTTGLFRGAGARTRIFGFLLFLICLAPLSRLFPYGGTEEVALRFMYLPLAGLCLFGGITLDDYFPRGRPRAAAAAAAILAAVVFGGLTRQVSRFWRDGGTFWTVTTENFPDFDIAPNQLASHYYSLRDYRSTIAQAERAIELNPDIAYSYVLKGLAHRDLGENSEARRTLSRALRILEKMGRDEEAGRVRKYLEGIGLRRDGLPPPGDNNGERK